MKQSCPGSPTSGGVSNVSFAFRGNDRSARRSTRSSCTTRSRPAWTWHRQRRRPAVYDDIEPRAPGAGRGRRPRSPPRRHRTPAPARASATPAERAWRRPRKTWRGATSRSRSGSPTPWSRASTTWIVETPRRRACECARPLEVIEGPADGRHERRRRPVRRRQDVPAPGRQERPGDEEGGGLPGAVPGGGAGRRRAAAPARS